MPTYDYTCSKCGATTEFVHSINGNPPGACPACGAERTLTKAFNPPTIHFKGSGWAKKDRSGGRPKPTKSSESTESGATQGSDKGSDQSSDKGSGGEGGSKSGSSSGADGAGAKAESSPGSSSGDRKSSSPAASTPSAAD